VSIKI